MKQKEKKEIKLIVKDLENIFFYHNKNLNLKQYSQIGNAIMVLRHLGE